GGDAGALRVDDELAWFSRPCCNVGLHLEDRGAPLAPIHRIDDSGVLDQGAIWLKVNGQDKQRSNLSSLIWSVAEVIANLSEYFALVPGDLIFTGTPAGVGKVAKGDVLIGGIDGLGELSIELT
ncbi:MAG: fumarylacetoacetate hydrolase family protein, partial [Proteobacteria bacterium]|nr:fumarylacetoacetate hydrolase family protein [Pseudomonadota bacterium]